MGLLFLFCAAKVSRIFKKTLVFRGTGITSIANDSVITCVTER